MKICICDDEMRIHKIVKEYISKFTSNKTPYIIIDTFSAEELIDKYSNSEMYDIIFLDIEMDKMTGMEAAEKIHNIKPDTIIIFISNHPKYVFDSFKVEPLHFLVKPIFEDEFFNVFQRAINKYKILNSSITLKWQSERYVIKVDSIKYIEGYKRHIAVFTDDGEYEAIGKIPEMLNMLSPYGFIQTHQGFIVNMDYIKRFDKSDVVLFDNTRVMISVRKRTEALRAFDRYLKQRKW